MRLSRISLIVLWIGIVCWCVTTPTSLSHDIRRYIWDGALMAHGINPYTALPTLSTAQQIGEVDLYHSLDWKNKYSPYPPLAQAVFVLSYIGYVVGGYPLAKLTLGLPVLGIFYLLQKRIGAFSLLFIFNPLVLFESFNGGHIDIWMMWILMGSLDLLTQRRHLFAAVLMAGAILTKVTPVLLIPLCMTSLYVRKRDQRGTILQSAIASMSYGVLAAVVTIVGYLTLYSNILTPLRRYRDFAGDMDFHATVFRYLMNIEPSRSHAQLGGLAIVMGVYILVSVSFYYKRISLESSAFVILLTAMTVSPVYYTWYGLVLVPLVVLACAGANRYVPYVYFLGYQALHLGSYVGEWGRLWPHAVRQYWLFRMADLHFMYLVLVTTTGILWYAYRRHHT